MFRLDNSGAKAQLNNGSIKDSTESVSELVSLSRLVFSSTAPYLVGDTSPQILLVLALWLFVAAVVVLLLLPLLPPPLPLLLTCLFLVRLFISSLRASARRLVVDRDKEEMSGVPVEMYRMWWDGKWRVNMKHAM